MDHEVERTEARTGPALSISPTTSTDTLVAATPHPDSPTASDLEKTLQDASQRLAGLTLDAIEPTQPRQHQESATPSKTPPPPGESVLEALQRKLREAELQAQRAQARVLEEQRRREEEQRRRVEEQRRREESDRARQRAQARADEAQRRRVEEQRRREESDRARQRAEARAAEVEQREHRLTVHEVREHIDRLLLVGLSRYTSEKDPPLPMGAGRMPDILPSSHREPPGTAKPSRKKKIIPTELAFDSAVQVEVAALGRLLDAPALGARRTTITENLVTTLGAQYTRQQLRIERDFEGCWKALVLLLVGAVLEQLASIVVEHTRAQQESNDATASRSIAEQLLDLYPHIPWREIEDNLCWTHCIPSTLNHSASGSEAQGSQDSRSTTTSAGDRPTNRHLAAPGSASTHSDRPPSQYGRIISDIFASLKLDGTLLLYHVTEIKAYNARSSQRVEVNFRAPRPASTDVRADEPSEPSDYADFDLLEAVRCQTIDFEMVHVIKQCFTYIRAHACPFVHLNVGLTHVFFRYDHHDRNHAVHARAKDDAPPPPIKLHYYIVSKYPSPPPPPTKSPTKEEGPEAKERAEGEGGWRQKHALLDAVLVSLLKALDERFATTEEQRVWWTADLDQHAYEAVEPTSPSSRRTADTASSAGDPDRRPADDHDDDDDDRAGDGGARGGPRGGAGKSQGDKSAGRGARNNDGGGGGGGGGKGKTSRPADGGGQLVAAPARKVLGELDANVVRPARAAAPRTTLLRPSLCARPRYKPLFNLGSKLASTKLTAKLHAPLRIRLDALPAAPLSAALTTGGGRGVYADSSEVEWDGTARYAGRYSRLVTRHWCTPSCLAGLKYGLTMDASCPNAHLHCRIPGCDHAHQHARSLDQVRTEMLQAIVSTDGPQRVWRAMEPILRCSGARAQLFRYTHAALGYAFAAKGVHVFHTNLLHKETHMLQHLWQSTITPTPSKAEKVDRGGEVGEVGGGGFGALGEFRYGGRGVKVHVPVACGVVERGSFDFAYPIPPGDEQLGGTEDQMYSAWMLLSYHSLGLHRTASLRALTTKLDVPRQETPTMLRALREWCRDRLGELGVRHDDLHDANLLWCTNLDAVVVIDFERAEWV